MAYAALGVFGGLVSVAFTKMTLYLRLKFRLLPKWSVSVQPVVGGIVVGVLGFFVPQVLGVGYKFVSDVLSGNFLLTTVALLIVLKLIATSVCYASGNTGGIFGPSLFLGAMVGATLGSVVHHWFPLYTATPGAYALVGMGSTFAGIIRTPLTSVFMIFELTRDYSIVVPLMIANLTSFYISYRLQRKPIYEALSEQDGIHLPNPEEARNRQSRTVAEFMREATEFVAPETPLQHVPVSPRGWIYLVGKDNHLAGVVSAARLQDVAVSDPTRPISELMTLGPAESTHNEVEDLPHVHPDHPIELALERMGMANLSVLPVLDRANVHLVRGIVHGDEILRSYGIPIIGDR
jgi:CIC family chloride channel protein